MTTFYVINNPTIDTDNYFNIIQTIKKMPNISVWHDTQYPGHATYLAKRLAQKIIDPSAVILAVGDNRTLNDVLNGLLAGNREIKIPLAFIPIGLDQAFLQGTHIKHVSELISQIQHTHQSQLLNVGKIYGDAPRHITKYFVNRIDIGCHADTAESSEQDTQKSALMHRLVNMVTPSTVPITQQPFQITILNGKHYRQVTNTTLLTIKNCLDFNQHSLHTDDHQTPLNLVVTEKNIVANFFTMLPNFIRRNKIHAMKTIHHIALENHAHIHVHDIQTGYIDGNLLGNGTFAFTVQYETYPFWL